MQSHETTAKAHNTLTQILAHMLGTKMAQMSVRLYWSKTVKGMLFIFSTMATGYPIFRFGEKLLENEILISIPLLFTFVVGLIGFRAASRWGWF